MNELRQFLRNFLRKDGIHIFSALFIGKITAFLTSLFIIRLLSKDDFGSITIVLSWFSIFASFSGLGLPSGLLRFGSLQEDETERAKLSAVLFWKGIWPQVVISGVFFVLNFFYITESTFYLWIFLSLSVRLLGLFLVAHIQADQRIRSDNKGFALSSNVVNIGGFLLMLAATTLYGVWGYIFSMAFAPFIVLFWLKDINFSYLKGYILNLKEIRRYGLQLSFTALLSDALFSADILLLGCFCSSSEVAGYRTAILIPSNLAFLALIFINTDFPEIAKNYQNKNFLLQYVRNYYRIFIPVVSVIFAVGFFFRAEIIKLLFGERYLYVGRMFVPLLLAYLFNLLTRNLFGNVLGAVGKVEINTVISAATVITLVVLGWCLVPVYGVQGMVYSVLVTFIVSGGVYAVAFLRYISRQK